MARRLHLLFLLAACGPGDGSSSSGTDTSTAASSTTGTGESTDGTGSTGPTSTGTTGPATPCGCPEGQVCVQWFDGLCSQFNSPMCVDANGCVPGNPCTPECAVFCGDEEGSVTCSDSRYCEEEIHEAVRCYGI